MLNSWPLCIAPVHSIVGEGARLLWRKQIVWLRTTCRSNAAERRKPLKSGLRGCRATILFCITHLHVRHVLCAMRMPSCKLNAGSLSTNVVQGLEDGKLSKCHSCITFTQSMSTDYFHILNDRIRKWYWDRGCHRSSKVWEPDILILSTAGIITQTDGYLGLMSYHFVAHRPA